MRRALWGLLAVLTLVTPVGAGTAVLDWDYPLASQRGTTYTLHIVTLHGGVPTAMERTIDPLPVTQCRQWPDPQANAETLCASVCLDPGDYTLSLFAVRSGVRSGESNLLDLDLTTTTPCQPGVPVPPSAAAPQPPAPTPQKGGTVAGGLAMGGAAAALLAAQNTPPPLPTLVNLACVTWAITGVCMCAPFTPCVTVEYWEPAFLIETTKNPGDTMVPVLGDVLTTALAAAGVPALGGGGAGNATGGGHTNLQYGEVHVWAFPQVLGGPCTGCGPSGVLALHYASELDSASWRTAVAVPSPLDLITQIGVWAHMYPRGGKVIHASEPVASAVQAVRAMDIIRNPIGLPPNADAHVIVAPGSAGTPLCMQMAWPKKTPCFNAGFPNALWESGALALRGKYLWIAWAKKSFCVDPAQTTCGITTPGIGTYGANSCLLPQLP